jgi:hypothetical protein
MTSQINPNNIDGNYPVPGVPNNTQGFRSNFTETQTNFQFAAQEITDLQNKVVLKEALAGTTLNNNMSGGKIYNVELQDVGYAYLPIAATSGSIAIDYSAAQYQQINTTGSVSLSFINWPASGIAGSLRVGFNITNVAHTVTLPAAVNQGVQNIAGISPGTPGVTNTITFGAPGNYAFEFVSVDEGVNIWIFDNSRPTSNFSSPVTITSNAVSNSSTTGALVVTGGVGIDRNLNVNGNVGIAGNLNVAGTIVGNIQVTGVNVVGNVQGNVLIGNAGIIPNLTVNQLSSDDSSFVTVVDGLDVKGDVTFTGNISPAAANKIGGISPGPGVVVSQAGQLTIDTSGLALSFGDFTANTNILTIINPDEDMILATAGNAEIQLVGNIGFYSPNGLPPSVENRYFSATGNGQIQITVTTTDGEGAVQIIGSTTGNVIEPGIAGALLHLTGQLDIPCRSYYDGNGDYVSWVARRWNGNVDVPTQVLAGEDVLRINSTAATDAGGGNVGNVAMAQIRTTALENQTATGQGSSITFTVTPVGSAANARVDVATITTANGVSATRLTSSSPTGGIGYIAGAGGTVTQEDSKATGVTLNTISGEITTNNSTVSGDASVSFVLTNSAIANTDVMIINHVSGGTIGKYTFNAVCNNGSADITISNRNSGGGSGETAALVLRYVVIKGATA